MLLIIPGLFAERGRSIVLWTFSSGLLIDGPIRSIYVNLQRLYDTVICMYQVTLKESCQSKVINRKVISNVSRNVQFNFSNILTCSIYFSVKILWMNLNTSSIFWRKRWKKRKKSSKNSAFKWMNLLLIRLAKILHSIGSLVNQLKFPQPAPQTIEPLLFCHQMEVGL